MPDIFSLHIRWSRLLVLTALVAMTVSLSSTGSSGGGLSIPEGSDSTSTFAFDHSAWEDLLRNHVLDGRVDYAALLADRSPLDRYLGRVARAAPWEWSLPEQQAFWINVYNARMIASVLDAWPVDSVLDIGRILGVPTLKVFRQKHTIAGHALSLDNIEHDILRGRFDDPRVHAALVCASRSCPALSSEAYQSRDLDRQLDAAMHAFIQDVRRNRVFEKPPRLSRIFKWYREDFADDSQSVWQYVRAWLGEDERRRYPEEAQVRFLPYDWSLNTR